MGKRKSEQAGKGTVQGVLEKSSIVPGTRGLVRYVLGTAICSRCANAANRTTCLARPQLIALLDLCDDHGNFYSLDADTTNRSARFVRPPLNVLLAQRGSDNH